LIFVLVFASRDLELKEVPAIESHSRGVDRQSHTGLTFNYYYYYYYY